MGTATAKRRKSHGSPGPSAPMRSGSKPREGPGAGAARERGDQTESRGRRCQVTRNVTDTGRWSEAARWVVSTRLRIDSRPSEV